MLLVQISDTHLRQDAADPRHAPLPALARAVAAINAMRPRPDGVVFTGDLLDRSAADPAAGLAVLDRLQVPLLPLPGNHDRGVAFRAALSGRILGGQGRFAPGHQSFAVPLAGHLVIGLDSCATDGSGCLDDARLGWLAARLAEGDGPALLALHHPPFATGIPRLDAEPMIGAEGLAAVLRASRRVTRLVCGHTHRAIATRFAGIEASSAPALGHVLALSLLPGAPHAHVAEPPGFQIHLARGDAWITHTVTLGHAAPATGFAGPLSAEAAARLIDP